MLLIIPLQQYNNSSQYYTNDQKFGGSYVFLLFLKELTKATFIWS